MEAKKFLEALKLVSSFCARRSPRPDLQKVCIRDGFVEATDLETHIRVPVDLEGFSGVLPPDVLQRLLAGVQQFNISSKNGHAYIETGNGFFKLLNQDADEFPPFPDVPGSNGVYVYAYPLAAAIKRASIFAEKDGLSSISCVRFQGVDDDDIKVVATDGRRLYVESEAVNGRKKLSANVPAEACRKIAAALSSCDDEEECAVTISNGKIKFETERLHVCTSLSAGQFPNWEAIVPSGEHIKIQVDGDSLASACKQALACTDRDNRRCKFVLEDQALVLSVNGVEVGSCKVKVPVTGEGEAYVYLNVAYVLQFLQCLPLGMPVVVRIYGKDNPVMFDWGRGMYLLMPMAE